MPRCLSQIDIEHHGFKNPLEITIDPVFVLLTCDCRYILTKSTIRVPYFDNGISSLAFSLDIPVHPIEGPLEVDESRELPPHLSLCQAGSAREAYPYVYLLSCLILMRLLYSHLQQVGVHRMLFIN